jgi:hypothetical protein
MKCSVQPIINFKTLCCPVLAAADPFCLKHLLNVLQVIGVFQFTHGNFEDLEKTCKISGPKSGYKFEDRKVLNAFRYNISSQEPYFLYCTYESYSIMNDLNSYCFIFVQTLLFHFLWCKFVDYGRNSL